MYNRQVRELVTALHHDSHHVRTQAAEDLIRLGEYAVEPLIGLLETAPEVVVVHIIDILGMIGDQRAVAPLMTLLYDEKRNLLRVDLRLALIQIGQPAIPDLLRALHGSGRGVRHSAVLALGAIGDRRATEHLAELLEDPDPYIVEDVQRILEKWRDE